MGISNLNDYSDYYSIGQEIISNCEYKLKRYIDIILSATGILASLPLSALIAILIYIEDRGSVFYTQERVGKNGGLFLAYKFRTMIVDSDEIYGPTQARVNDPRITKIGKILRYTAMDEIPQLWSILIGDMSFVGPRALLPAEKETGNDSDSDIVHIKDIPGYKNRQSVKPGLTGVAQILHQEI